MMILKSRKAGRLRESNIKYEDLYRKMEVLYRVLSILKRNGFDGVIIPDHAPQMNCAAPWHAGMAFALGFLKAGIMSLEGGR
jgi:hypothetical protein